MIRERSRPLAAKAVFGHVAKHAQGHMAGLGVIEICDRYSLPYLDAMLRKGWYPRVSRPTLVGLSCERFDDKAVGLTRRPGRRAFAHWYLRHIYGPAFDAHIAVSEYAAQELRAALPDRPSSFVRVAPLGVDPERYAPSRL